MEGVIDTLMRVEMYSPDRMYGFVESGPERVFFHVGSFVGGVNQPPPIIGEEVRVDYTPSLGIVEKAPRATRVERVAVPVELVGVVESFNPDNGWGWAKADGDTESCYLHRSEVGGGRLPVPGQEVRFYKGHKNGRARACHVQVGRVRG